MNQMASSDMTGALKPRPVVVNRLSKSYGQVGVIAGLDMRVDPGEFVSIVGPSGVGKTTLLRCLSGLMPPTSGEVTVGGQKVTEPLGEIGLVFQDYRGSLMPWMTTLDNVAFPLQGRGVAKAEREKIARRWLDDVGLAGAAEKYPWELSGGMQQRASLCRALIHEPEMLMLDEPFGALDAFTREELWCVLRDLWSARRFNVVLVTHDLREAVFLADTVYVMSKRPGRILSRRDIELPRPRELETTYSDDFNALVLELRTQIGH